MEKQIYQRPLQIADRTYSIYDIKKLAREKGIELEKLPFSIRILAENLLRKLDGRIVSETDLDNILGWKGHYDAPVEIPYHPARVLMQDFTGVPAVVDLAAMRDAVHDLGEDPRRINPLVPVHLIVDHSVQVDYYGTPEALTRNVAKEYERNGERYALLKWAQQNFDNFHVVPPNSGICHQVNLEHLGQVVMADQNGKETLAYPDTLVGTDSHTTMINSVGVLGWGVGGIEAEAVMLGQPYYMSIPEVVGVKLVGKLPPDITATDLVLAITEILRKHKVVEKFVEYFGPGLKNLTVPDRATISNMSPEYGATIGFFPVDETTTRYLKLTGRGEQAALVEAYTRELGLFYDGENDPEYSETLTLDLATIALSIAGPARPQDRIPLCDCQKQFDAIMGCEYKRDTDLSQLSQFTHESGTQTQRGQECLPVEKRRYDLKMNGQPAQIEDGSVVIAALTSCTNTSNPYVMLGAGLIAQKAVQKGIRVPAHVKISLAPGSKVVIDYLQDAGLLSSLQKLGFHVAGFGCTTCIGNSGPLDPALEALIDAENLTVAAVLSGNRNFEARIHQKVRANFLASPMLVVLFAIAGRIDINFETEPLAQDENGKPVYFRDLWPSAGDIEPFIRQNVKSGFFTENYGRIFDGDNFWRDLPVTAGTTFAWEPDSTYIKKPPYFNGFSLYPAPPQDVDGARALLLLGDSVTTDHISPAGAIAKDYPAGRYLIEKGVSPESFNSYGSRRGNHEVMLRGTFGNIRIKNRLVAPKEGSFTLKYPGTEQMYIYDAAEAYRAEKIPLVVVAGQEYGTGSSRDWAAKGTNLLGIRAVLAQSYERIHRSNLVGMGVLPLMFQNNETAASLGLDGSESYRISGIGEMSPRKRLPVEALKENGQKVSFEVMARLDTEVEVDYFMHGGILPYVLRKMLQNGMDA